MIRTLAICTAENICFSLGKQILSILLDIFADAKVSETKRISFVIRPPFIVRRGIERGEK